MLDLKTLKVGDTVTTEGVDEPFIVEWVSHSNADQALIRRPGPYKGLLVEAGARNGCDPFHWEKFEPPLIDPQATYEVLLGGNCMNAVEGIGIGRAATVIRITGYEIVKQRNV